MRRQDLRLALLWAATVVCLGLYVRGSYTAVQAPRGGWRKVDVRALERLIKAGELSEREASFYREDVP